MDDSDEPVQSGLEYHQRLRDPLAVRYWARQLRLTEAELRNVIVMVRRDVQAVRQWAHRPLQPRRGNIRRYGG